MDFDPPAFPVIPVPAKAGTDKHHPAGIASHVSITRPHHEALGYLWPKGFPKPDEAAAKKLIHAATLKVPADLRP
jgi:hypothetical protein